MANTKEKLEEKPVADLREMAAKKDIEGRSSMNKAELVDELATAKGSTTSSDKSEKRLFQSGDDPTRKEHLTKAEAEKRGHYWATEEEINQRPGGVKGST